MELKKHEQECSTGKNVTRRKTKILALWASFPWAPLGAAGCCPASCQTSVPPPLSGAAGSPPATQRGTAPATCRVGTGIEHPHTKCLSRVFIEPRSKYPSSHPPNFWILDFSYLLKRLVCLDICNRHEIKKKTIITGPIYCGDKTGNRKEARRTKVKKKNRQQEGRQVTGRRKIDNSKEKEGQVTRKKKYRQQ